MTKEEFNEKWAELSSRPDFAHINDWYKAALALIAEFDKDRKPTADAAEFLHVTLGVEHEWLRAMNAERIRDVAKMQGLQAHKMGLKVSPLGYLSGFELPQEFMAQDIAPRQFFIGFGAFSIAPDAKTRKATADAAAYLWSTFCTSEAWLKKAGSATIRDDSAACYKAMSALKIKVNVVVQALGGEVADSIKLDFYKGEIRVGGTVIKGKTTSRYVRVVELDRDYDNYRMEASSTARFSVERVSE